MLPLLPIPTRTITIGASSGVNLYTQASSPYYAERVICTISGAIGAPNSSTPAFRTGSGWKPGSWIYITNNSTITGASGAPGANGVGGTGGTGGDQNLARAGTSGSAGSSASAGTPGGSAFYVDTLNSDVTLLLNNLGTITGGAGGAGATGGGGGGGGGF